MKASSESCAVGSWTYFSFLKTFYLPSHPSFHFKYLSADMVTCGYYQAYLLLKVLSKCFNTVIQTKMVVLPLAFPFFLNRDQNGLGAVFPYRDPNDQTQQNVLVSCSMRLVLVSMLIETLFAHKYFCQASQ